MQIQKKLWHIFGFSLKPTALQASSSSVDITEDKSTRETAENAECLVTFPGFFCLHTTVRLLMKRLLMNQHSHNSVTNELLLAGNGD